MLTATDWIAVASVALPLIVKAFSDWQANAVANHNAALARITGMASREAATIESVLQNAGPNVNFAQLKASLVANAADSIFAEMGTSTDTVGADAAKLFAIVLGELNKIQTSKKAT